MRTRSNRRGFTIAEVLVAAGLLAPVLALALGLAVSGLRALSAGAARTGALRGVVALRERLAADLARLPAGRVPTATATSVAIPSATGPIVYTATPDGEVWRVEPGAPAARVGRLAAVSFRARSEGGRLTVELTPRAAAAPSYSERFTMRAGSRWLPAYRSVAPAPPPAL